MTTQAETPRRLVVGISGATGIAYGARILELLQGSGIETHLVISKAGELTRAHELGITSEALRALATHVHPFADVGAALSSGSFKTMGMVVAPCSMRTLGEIAAGVTSNLLTRAADVTLKERRPLVLMVRETPLTAVHLRNMLTVTQAGAIVAPPVPAFYTRPQSVDEMVTHGALRVLDLLGIDVGGLKRWGEDVRLGQATAGQGA
jgi:4-hydroxy-3-polyprenylbenzoate decarboxylase